MVYLESLDLPSGFRANLVEGATDMKRWAFVLSFAILVAALAGCKSKSVSRVYPADMDATWTAALNAVKTVTGHEPTKAAREEGRMVTDLVFGDVRQEYDSDSEIQNNVVDIRRAIITLTAVESGTKVAVRVQQGSASTPEEPPISNKNPAVVGVVFYTGCTEWQNKFLDDIAAELAAK